MNRESIIKARQERGLPNGNGRMAIHFASKLRAKLVQKEDGKSYYELTGHATVFNTPYKMYDMFGEYYEEVDRTALDESLAKPPDVVFLLNHRGLSMARTTNGTLELTKDLEGLYMRAWLNADRLDVRDLASAVIDELITEMSFAFMIDDDGYSWNEDYTKLTLTKLDIDRGDVSAVNYGANPFTDISARAPDIIRELRELPAGALPDAVDALNGVYAFAGDKLAEDAVRRYRSAGALVYRGAQARAQAMRDEGKTSDEIKAAFPDLDFSQWPIVDETGEEPEPQPKRSQRAAGDPDEDPVEVAEAVDATLDQASELLDGLDESSLPAEVLQAIDLIHAAEISIDQLLELLGGIDPDDMGELSAPKTETRTGVSDLDLLRKRLDHVVITGDSK